MTEAHLRELAGISWPPVRGHPGYVLRGWRCGIGQREERGTT